MKTLEDYQAFATELEALSEKHGIGLIGTDQSEGIYGEITLFDLSDITTISWYDPLSALTFIVEKDEYTADYILDNNTPKIKKNN
jgi:hypothetical protein